jgi:hypothetical protein
LLGVPAGAADPGAKRVRRRPAPQPAAASGSTLSSGFTERLASKFR